MQIANPIRPKRFATIKPRYNGFIGSEPDCSAALLVTVTIPTVETIMFNPCMTTGKKINRDAFSISHSCANTPPNIIAPIISAETLSNTSALLPTQSPTMSPTKSAITAGFRGSSSGKFCSTLPTKSAPTSAAFV